MVLVNVLSLLSLWQQWWLVLSMEFYIFLRTKTLTNYFGELLRFFLFVYGFVVVVVGAGVGAGVGESVGQTPPTWIRFGSELSQVNVEFLHCPAERIVRWPHQIQILGAVLIKLKIFNNKSTTRDCNVLHRIHTEFTRRVEWTRRTRHRCWSICRFRCLKQRYEFSFEQTNKTQNIIIISRLRTGCLVAIIKLREDEEVTELVSIDVAAVLPLIVVVVDETHSQPFVEQLESVAALQSFSFWWSGHIAKHLPLQMKKKNSK